MCGRRRRRHRRTRAERTHRVSKEPAPNTCFAAMRQVRPMSRSVSSRSIRRREKPCVSAPRWTAFPRVIRHPRGVRREHSLESQCPAPGAARRAPSLRKACTGSIAIRTLDEAMLLDGVLSTACSTPLCSNNEPTCAKNMKNFYFMFGFFPKGMYVQWNNQAALYAAHMAVCWNLGPTLGQLQVTGESDAEVRWSASILEKGTSA